MICRNARCAAPRERRSDRRTRAGNLDRRSRVRDAPLRRRYKISAAGDVGNGQIDFPITRGDPQARRGADALRYPGAARTALGDGSLLDRTLQLGYEEQARIWGSFP